MFTSRLVAVATILAVVLVGAVLAVPRPITVAGSQQFQQLQAPYSLTLNPTQDAWVDEEASATNFGTDPQLHVARTTGQRIYTNRDSLLLFDLTTLPVGATVSKATLRLTQVQWSGATQYIIYPEAIWAPWSETTVTWNNKPASYSVGDPPIAVDATNSWKDFDLTPMVTNWAIGEIQNYGVLLRGNRDTVGERLFGAREDEKLKPVLVVEYSLPAQCTEILSPATIPSPGLINFDDLIDSTVIGTHYQASHGVTFEDIASTRAIIYGNEPALAKSPPNVASNNAVVTTSVGLPMRIFFDSTKTHVGFWMGNGSVAAQTTGVLSAYDSGGTLICSVSNPVTDPHTEFIGVYDQYGRIESVALDYGATSLSESIDDLYFAPVTGEAVLPIISSIRPTDWITTTQTPSVYASVIDAGSGISVTSASYRYSTNGGATWSAAWQAASVGGSNGVTTTQTMTATSVPFNLDSASQNLIEFRIADMNGNVGTAQSVIMIDTTPPTPPSALGSSDHTVNVWSSDNTVEITWSGAADATSGVSGYSVLFDQSTSTLPDNSLDTSATSATSSALADANNLYAHVRTVDWAGHWSATATHLGPFKIDIVPPANPTTVSSSSHSTSIWSSDPTIPMSWSGAADGSSGVSGYSFWWDTSPSTLPDTAVDTYGTSTTSSALTSGNNEYFHIRTRDAAGNWSPTAVHRGPYYIDTIAPSSWTSSPSYSSSSSFLVSWTGTDAHSGIANYDVQYRDLTTGGGWTNWRLSAIGTSSTFYGSNGHIYQFRSRARDNVGNLEAYPLLDSETSVNNVDVWVRSPGLEVNQAVQDLNNSVTLIAGKRTFVRAYVQSDSGMFSAVPARLRVYRGPTLMGTLSPSNSGGTTTVKSSPSRDTLNDAYYFDVPTGWLSAGSVTFQFEINTPQKYAENDYGNNVRITTVNFVNSPTMNLLIVDVPYRFGGVTRNIRTLDRTLLESWLRRAYPIKNLNVSWAYLDPPYGSLPSAGTVNLDLAWNKVRAILFDGEDPWMRYYGMAIDTGGFMRGLSAGTPANVASGPTGPTGGGWDTDGSYGDWYGGHENGHSYGRAHVRGAPYAGPGGCGDEAGPDGSYPYPNGDISPNQTMWSSTAIYGLDANGTTPTVIPPSWKDVMTYCPNEWVSDYTYEAIYNRMKAEKPVSHAQIQAMIAAGGEHLAVLGSVITPTDEITLTAFYRIPNAFDVFERDVNGLYHIRFLGVDDAQLVDYPFSPRFSSSPDEPVGLISEVVPWITDTKKVVILHGSTALITRTVSANAPTVTITYPNSGETLNGNSVTVTWNAGDDDGDTLTYSLDFSRDGGVTWEPRSANIAETQATLDLGLLPGTTQGRFRVWASDGVNTAVDTSDANFTVPSKPPTITSILPASGQTFVVSQTVSFEGQAFDAEDGLLPDDKLGWSSDLMGVLGTGELLQVTDLVSGTHTITLTATDSNANMIQATTTLTVTDETTTTGTTYQVFLPIVLRDY